MTKYVKRLAADAYLKDHPKASVKTVVRAVGCSAATVYLARVRLGMPTSLINSKKVGRPPSSDTIKKFSVIADDLGNHLNEITKLQKSFALAKTAIYGLHVVVAALIAVLVFKG